MRKIATLLSTALLLSLSFTASAFEADFSAKIRGVNTEDNNAKVVGIAHFKDTNIQLDEAFTIAYTVYGNSEVPLFTGSATITSEETEVKIGNRNDGKITIKYDSETGFIKTRFVKKVILDDDFNYYSISATSGNWEGYSSISSNILTDINPVDEELLVH